MNNRSILEDAKWVCDAFDSKGRLICHGEVWQKSIERQLIHNETWQVWNWRVTWGDSGSSAGFDWGTSKRMAVDAAKQCMVGCGANEKELRFKKSRQDHERGTR